MRELIRELIDDAPRSGDRISVEAPASPLAQLATETIRLSRMATSIHLVGSARLIAEASLDRSRATPMRECAG